MGEILAWSESFAVGHEPLDAEHRHLVELINAIGLMVPETHPIRPADLLLPKVLQRVTVEHIRHENAILYEIKSGSYMRWEQRTQIAPYLRKMAATAFDEHVVEQTALLARLSEIVTGPIEALCDGLKSWFVDYVHGYEADLKPLFQAASVVAAK